MKRGVARQRYLSIGLLLLEQGRIICLAEGDDQFYGPRSAEVPPENTHSWVAFIRGVDGLDSSPPPMWLEDASKDVFYWPAPESLQSGEHEAALDDSPEQSADAGSDPHGGDAPESDAGHGLAHRRAAGAGTDRAEKNQAQQRCDCHCRQDPASRYQDHSGERKRRAGRERGCGGQGRLNGPCRGCIGNSELVTCVGTQDIPCTQLLGHLARESGIETACDVNPSELVEFALWIGGQLCRLASEIRLLGVRLRTDRNIFTSRHRHCARHQSSGARKQHGRPIRICGRDADYEACSRHEAIIGTKDRCSEPADAGNEVTLRMNMERAHGQSLSFSGLWLAWSRPAARDRGV